MAVAAKDVIIADDDHDDLMFFEMAVKDTGIPVVMRHAVDGQVLFVLLKEQIPHILFLDINMPCEDGISCVRKIRQSKEYDDLAIIMYTSSVYHKTVEECYKTGANGYMIKPHSLTRLTEQLKKALSTDWAKSMESPSMATFRL